jgi:hypothetical protein
MYRIIAYFQLLAQDGVLSMENKKKFARTDAFTRLRAGCAAKRTVDEARFPD